jgi:Fe-S-cluster-containing dehydrogenase component
MKLDRRTFFKVTGAAGAASLAGAGSVRAATTGTFSRGKAVLVDTTLCVGCRGCEAACSEANHLPAPELPDDARVFAARRSTGPATFTVVNRGERLAEDGGTRYAKSQCMHCLEPACASVCPVRAFEKQPGGPVVYHANRCIGCRYCMISCPFGVPKYEYDKAIPYVRKCTFCAERQAAGQAPACTSVCPTGALQFGDRAELLEVARERIYQKPSQYVRHIYGEHEAGGTSWLYIGDVPLQTLGLRGDVGDRPIPELTRTALAGVPFVMTLAPPLLMGLYAFSRQRAEVEAGKEHSNE